MMIYYGSGVNSQLILAPLFLVMMFALAVAVGVLLSALNVRFRDVKHMA
jgi:ABC-type polysaccharide/polyol phosphate export permease